MFICLLFVIFEERDVLEERGKWKEEREYSAADNATDNNQEKSQWTFQGNIQGTNHISFHFPLSSFLYFLMLLSSLEP